MSRVRFAELPAMPPILVKLTHSKKKMLRWNSEFGGSSETLREIMAKSGAVTNTYVHDEQGAVSIVWMRPNIEQSAAEDAALLAHEATHVTQEYFRFLGEENPSDELMAYAVQFVTEQLVREHYDWKQRQFDSAASNGIASESNVIPCATNGIKPLMSGFFHAVRPTER